MSLPITLRRLLDTDREHGLDDVVEQLGYLAARVVLLRLAAFRRGEHELTQARLGRLAASLQHASEDARAAQRAWQQGR
jgi:hypothetical protein